MTTNDSTPVFILEYYDCERHDDGSWFVNHYYMVDGENFTRRDTIEEGITLRQAKRVVKAGNDFVESRWGLHVAGSR